jgi:hypothetical protein
MMAHYHCGRHGTFSSCSTKHNDTTTSLIIAAIGSRRKLLGNVARHVDRS